MCMIPLSIGGARELQDRLWRVTGKIAIDGVSIELCVVSGMICRRGDVATPMYRLMFYF
jgi:hypothetical protein